MSHKARSKRLVVGILAGALSLGVGTAAWAQTGTTADQGATGQGATGQGTTGEGTTGQAATAGEAGTEGVRIELNKLEQQGDACRAYLLFENEQGGEYPVYRLDLVLFDKQGRIDRRIAVDASPLRAGKSVVKLFDLSGLQCDGISKILLNDIAPCEDASGAREDCVVNARLSTLTDVDFYK